MAQNSFLAPFDHLSAKNAQFHWILRCPGQLACCTGRLAQLMCFALRALSLHRGSLCVHGRLCTSSCTCTACLPCLGPLLPPSLLSCVYILRNQTALLPTPWKLLRLLVHFSFARARSGASKGDMPGDWPIKQDKGQASCKHTARYTTRQGKRPH